MSRRRKPRGKSVGFLAGGTVIPTITKAISPAIAEVAQGEHTRLACRAVRLRTALIWRQWSRHDGRAPCYKAPCLRRAGFTLIELLVVIGIIILLVALTIPAFYTARSAVNRVKCAANLKQIATAGLLYVADNDGAFPVPGQLQDPWAAGGQPSWLADANLSNLPLNPYVQNNIKLWRCPADTAARGGYWGNKPFYKVTGTSYVYNSYAGSRQAVLDGKQRAGLAFSKINQIKNPSRMVFFADQDARVIVYSAKSWKDFTLWWHSEPNTSLKANIAFVDGSVRFLDIVPADQAEFSFFND